MAYKKPESMEECVYFTQRVLEADGKEGEIVTWVLREDCSKCGKAKMGKPRDSEGKVKIRAKEYVCPECGHEIKKEDYEGTLAAYAQYVCPHCSEKGEGEVPFKRKNISGIPTLRFECAGCKGFLDVTKKMKKKKIKKK